MDRLCRACEGRLRVYGGATLGGIRVVDRYRCSTCGTRFDLVSGFGQIFLCFGTLVLPGAAILLPDQKFGDPRDRWKIFALCMLFSVTAWAVVLRSRKRAKENPLLS